ELRSHDPGDILANPRASEGWDYAGDLTKLYRCRGAIMISARWFIFGFAALLFVVGIVGLRTPVVVDSRVPMSCAEALTRYNAFMQRGIEPADKVVPNHSWAYACENAIAERNAWAWPAVLVGGAVLLGALLIRRGPGSSPTAPAG
ncbi:MAG: hypothetical protein ACRDTF_10190, partial [Pseudonocardiaceae bacterium]